MEGLTIGVKVGFGLGHVLNDLCASMWFTYLLIFYHKVLYFNNSYAGVVLLVGQLADGLSTTFVGFLSDRPDDNWLCRKYGRRKSWHLVGTLCVISSFPFIFLPCLNCRESDQWAQLIYYSAFAVIFQFGWASCQISHLALIPALTSCQNERTGLTAIRYSMTVTANIFVYLIAIAFFGVQCSQGELSDKDEGAFRNIMLLCVGVGAVCSLIFHLLVKEDVDPQDESDSNQLVRRPNTKLPTLQWFKEPSFYIVAVIYMSTRLFVNLSQAYMPLYVQESLQLKTVYIAIIPLVMFSAGFVTSFLMKFINRKAGRKATYLLGAVISLAAAVWVYYGAGDGTPGLFFRHYGIFFAAVLFGAGGSTVLVTSLSLTAELIGENCGSAAFVYGAMSFTDKVSNGLAVMVIQHFIPCLKCCPACKWYFRDVLFFGTGSAAVLGALATLALIPFKVGQRRTRAVQVQETEEVGSARERSDEPSERTPLIS